MYFCSITGDGISQGKIIQRFPEKDWEDTPFVGGMELFCQPVGWILTPEMQEPKFFVSLLSDNDGNRYFCACLSFHEKLSISPSKNDSKQDSSAALNIESYKLPGLNHSLASTNHIMYAPTCLVLVSRHDYAETFRNWWVSTFCLLFKNQVFNNVYASFLQPKDNLHSAY